MGTVGVIVGRFQVNDLHEGHKDFIAHVMECHKNVIIFLGITNTLGEPNNALDFITRKKMLLNDYPDITVLPIKDMRSDKLWSKKLDEKIAEISGINSVTLYGSRDSFISHYHGKHTCVAYEQTVFISGAQIRQQLSDEVIGAKQFRTGVIYGAYNRYPSVHPTVDIFIYRTNDILIGRKPDETAWRLVGGFVDPKDDSYESAAKREAYEETKLELADFQYVLSKKIDDWRYRGEQSKIFTTLFMAKYVFGRPEPSDDIEELKWVHVDEISKTEFVPEHKIMIEYVIDKFFKNQVVQ